MKLATRCLSFYLASMSLWACAAGAQDGRIAIFSDQGQSICTADLGFQSPLKLYVYAQLTGASTNGITGAEYGISRSDSTDWIFLDDYSPATSTGALVLGIGAVAIIPGVNVFWANCQGTPGGAVLLQCISVLDATGSFAGTPNLLKVEGHANPGNPFFRCPLVTLCDAPIYTKVCAGTNITTEVCPFPPGALACFHSSSGEFLINPIGSCDCGSVDNCLPTAVENRSWGEIKSLYRWVDPGTGR